MSQQRKTEWLEIVNDYHEKQYSQVYRSTVRFCDWLAEKGLINVNKTIRIADIGTGQGANIYYMANRFPEAEFTGIDLNPTLVDLGNAFFKSKSQTNCMLVEGDLYDLDTSHRGRYDGLVSLQTLSWLPDYKEPLEKMADLGPEWIALTSLFYEGDISCKIEVKDYTSVNDNMNYKESYYNIYSLSKVQDCLRKKGFTSFEYIPFEIDTDLPKDSRKGMGTYTERLEDGRRLQISGPLLMNWYFILAKKV